MATSNNVGQDRLGMSQPRVLSSEDEHGVCKLGGRAAAMNDGEYAWGVEVNLDRQLAWQRAVARAWSDPAGYGRELEKELKAALRKVGWEVPDGLTIVVEASVHPTVSAPSAEDGVAQAWARTTCPSLDTNGAAPTAEEGTLVLALPLPPADDRLISLAEADYDAFSRNYPLAAFCVCC